MSFDGLRVRFGRTRARLLDEPLRADEELLLTMVAALDPARPARAPALAEAVGMRRWRELDEKHDAIDEGGVVVAPKVRYTYELRDFVTLPSLDRPVQASALPLLIETEVFRFQFQVQSPPGETFREGFVLRLSPGIRIGGQRVPVARVARSLNRDWDMVKRCLTARGVRQTDGGFWRVDGCEVATREAARVVLGFDPP